MLCLIRVVDDDAPFHLEQTGYRNHKIVQPANSEKPAPAQQLGLAPVCIQVNNGTGGQRRDYQRLECVRICKPLQHVWNIQKKRRERAASWVKRE